MAASYEDLLGLEFPVSKQTYSKRDAMLYALALGLGSDPLDEKQLQFVYEDGLRVLPTMGVVLAHPGFWPREMNTGLDWRKIVHGEQGLTLHKPLPISGLVEGYSKIVDIIDKGEGKGALVYYQRQVKNAETGELLCTSTQTLFCRGDGGIGGPSGAVSAPHEIPAREPDYQGMFVTLPQSALLYRLCGDVNPLHADPGVAKSAGFDRPILHGLACFGIAGQAVLKLACDYQPEKLKSIQGRFTAPVFPGESLEVSVWLDGEIISYCVRVVERDVVVIDNGRAEITS